MSGITVLLHGFAGGGKSTLAGTAPGPRLILDAEGGSDWLAGEKVYWTDVNQAPPAVTDPNTSVIVNVTNTKVLEKVNSWLQSGKHPFNSVVIDSLTEVQKRFIDSIAGTDQMQQQQWGTLLRVLEKFVRDIKDLKVHDIRPLQAVVVITGSQNKEGEPVGPQLQGSLAASIPFFFDVVGFAQLVINEEQEIVQHVQILPFGGVIAKDRTGILSRTFGHTLVNPTITGLIQAASAK